MIKLLSIIIPTYNMEALLSQCLSSLVLETKELREKLDVIVVIDGATDRSSEIAHHFADRYPEMFSVIDKENGNYGSCINEALPRVQGKYVRILDADDSYETVNLPAYLNVLDEQDVDLVLTDFEDVNAEGIVLSRHGHSLPVHKVVSFSEIQVKDFIEMHSVTYRSSIFQGIDYYQTEGVSYTDMEWVFHPMSEVRNVYYHPEVIYKYLNGREGQTVDNKVLQKRLSHIEKGLWRQIVVYQQIPADNIAYGYLTEVLSFRIKFLYLTGMNTATAYDLLSFDQQLKKKSPTIYKTVESITIPVGIFDCQMPIIKMWRRVKSRRGMYLYPLYLLHVIVNKIKKFIH